MTAEEKVRQGEPKIEVCEFCRKQMTRKVAGYIAKLAGELAEARAERDQARATAAGLNRRCQQVESVLNKETGRRPWYTYYQAALYLFKEAQEQNESLRAEIARLKTPPTSDLRWTGTEFTLEQREADGDG